MPRNRLAQISLAAATLTALYLMTGCAAHQAQHREEVFERSTDKAANRPEWIAKLPKEDGRIFLVSTSTDGLSAETGIRLAQAYALAQLSEQARTEAKTNTTLKTKGQSRQLNDTIEWSSQAIFRSLRQDQVYWEKRSTQEGQRYSVWVLWSIPEKAYYEAQEEALASGN